MKKLGSTNRTIAVLISALVTIALTLMAGSAASSPRASSSAAPDKNSDPQAELISEVTGTTASGAEVTGTFTPLKFKRTRGELTARGVLNGVIEESDGSTQHFAVVRTLPVQSVNGSDVGVSGMAAAPACDILNLVLGPLDLNILGLEVHLDQVVLDIVAQPGAGNLLGNLLCAVAGLLDGGLDGLLGQVTNLLNRILGALGLRL